MSPTLICSEVSGSNGDRRPASTDYPIPVALALPVTAGSGGKSFYNHNALLATKQEVKAGAATLFGWHIYNPNAVVSYLQIFNKLAASVTVGTTVPDFVIGIPASSSAQLSADLGIGLSTGFTVAATTTATGNTAPATAGLVVSLFYK